MRIPSATVEYAACIRTVRTGMIPGLRLELARVLRSFVALFPFCLPVVTRYFVFGALRHGQASRCVGTAHQKASNPLSANFRRQKEEDHCTGAGTTSNGHCLVGHSSVLMSCQTIGLWPTKWQVPPPRTPHCPCSSHVAPAQARPNQPTVGSGNKPSPCPGCLVSCLSLFRMHAAAYPKKRCQPWSGMHA